MKWIVRHSERLDLHHEKWLKNKRYIENSLDIPLTAHGKKYIAVQAGLEIIKNQSKINKISYIYSSPMTRALETSLVIQKTIKDKTNIFIPIRIEYGLKETHIINDYEHKVYDIKKQKFIFKPNKQFLFCLDKKLKAKYTYSKYGKEFFDTNYISHTKFDKMKLRNKNRIDAGNISIQTLSHIIDTEKDNDYIISTHAGAIGNMISLIIQKLIPIEQQQKIWGTNWCALIGFNKNKILYGPNANYYKK